MPSLTLGQTPHWQALMQTQLTLLYPLGVWPVSHFRQHVQHLFTVWEEQEEQAARTNKAEWGHMLHAATSLQGSARFPQPHVTVSSFLESWKATHITTSFTWSHSTTCSHNCSTQSANAEFRKKCFFIFWCIYLNILQFTLRLNTFVAMGQFQTMITH